MLTKPEKLQLLHSYKKKQSLMNFSSGSVKSIIKNFYCWYAMHNFYFPPLLTLSSIYNNAKLTVRLHSFWNFPASLAFFLKLPSRNFPKWMHYTTVAIDEETYSYTSCKKTPESARCSSLLTEIFWPIRGRHFKHWNWFSKMLLDLMINFHHEHSIMPTSCPYGLGAVFCPPPWQSWGQ